MSVSGQSYAIGIDLGTTNSCVAVFRNDGVEVIPNELGERTTPSYVAFTDGGVVVGKGAKNQLYSTEDQGNVIFDAKRLIGRDFSNSSVQKDMKQWPFKVVEDRGNPLIEFQWKGEKVQKTPQEISMFVLQKLKQIAEDYLGCPVRDAVITVPAYFNDAGRHATKEAGQQAGLNVLRVLSEPTAAAIAYGLGSCPNSDELQPETKEEIQLGTAEKLVLVFDYGGGTFDASQLAIDGGFFQVRATSGDTHQGGEDLDNALMKYVLQLFIKKNKASLQTLPTGSTPAGDAALRRLKIACEHAKHTLSSSVNARLSQPAFWEQVDLDVTLSRARFEEIAKADFLRCIDPVKKLLDDAKMKPERIDEVVLVGGSTRIPKIRALLKDQFHKDPCLKIHPDEAVAYGAAVQAAVIKKENSHNVIDQLLLIDVTPLSLGVETAGNAMSVIIKRNSTLPVTEKRLYSTDIDNQTAVDICVYEGERSDVRENMMLGKVSLEGIPPAPAGVPRIAVVFTIDQDGLLNVEAMEEKDGKHCSIRITNEHGVGRLSKEEIQARILDAQKYEAQDSTLRTVNRARTRVLTFCEQIQVAVDKLTTQMTPEDKTFVLKELEQTYAYLQSSEHTATLLNYIQEYHAIKNKVDPILGAAYCKYQSTQTAQ